MSAYKIIAAKTRPVGRASVIVRDGKKRITKKWLEDELSKKCVKDGVYLSFREGNNTFLYEMKGVTLIEG